MRINKYLSEAGVCSRREADRLIEAKKVMIEDRIAGLGEDVAEGERVYVDGKEVPRNNAPVLLLYNKPKGIVCTAEKREKNNIIDAVSYSARIYPVGRLDKDSTGLILLTNQGELSNRILKARYHHEKEYVVTLNRPYDERFLRAMASGVYLSELDKKTRPCFVEGISGDNKSFRIILTQGLNRQIRRMCEELSYKVKELKRVRILNLTLDGIEEGKYREITDEEMKELVMLLDRVYRNDREAGKEK